VQQLSLIVALTGQTIMKPRDRQKIVHHILAAVAGFILLMPSAGEAQLSGFYTIGSDAVSLNNADFTALIDAANGLLRRPRLSQGDNTSWQNGQTGSHGTIVVTNTFHYESLLCHTLTYNTNPAAASSANTTILKWCKTPDGWKILS
jgi:surface antigen